jgi:hypothetical protein
MLGGSIGKSIGELLGGDLGEDLGGWRSRDQRDRLQIASPTAGRISPMRMPMGWATRRNISQKNGIEASANAPGKQLNQSNPMQITCVLHNRTVKNRCINLLI